MVDAGASDTFWPQRYKWAIRTAQMLEAYKVAWFEEPLRPDDIHDYAELRRLSPVPIAGGEVLRGRQSFELWLRAHALDIVQPDATAVGGISEIRRIGWMAADSGARLIPHGWNTAVGLAVDLQVASALPDTDLVEYIIGSPYVDELAYDRWKLDQDGYLQVPGDPGLGVALDPESVVKYTGMKGFLS
jgi:D-galactarolactone cycloisomerase